MDFHTKASVRRPLRQSLEENLRLYGWSLKGLYTVFLNRPFQRVSAPDRKCPMSLYCLMTCQTAVLLGHPQKSRQTNPGIFQTRGSGTLAGARTPHEGGVVTLRCYGSVHHTVSRMFFPPRYAEGNRLDQGRQGERMDGGAACLRVRKGHAVGGSKGQSRRRARHWRCHWNFGSWLWRLWRPQHGERSSIYVTEGLGTRRWWCGW
jgi:hypothetical protein